MTEKQVQNAIMRKWATDPRIRLFRQNVGVGIPYSEWLKYKQNPKYHPAKVAYGVEGMADLSGIIGTTGQRLAIEVKGEKGRQSKKQVNYEHMIREMGGVYILARCVEDVDLVLEAILNEKRY